MLKAQVDAGYLDISQTRLYFERAGTGIPLLLVHAGVADREQWNNEFSSLSENFQVIRYDLRGYGASGPARGSFSHLQDLTNVIKKLNLTPPLILMGCSLGAVLSLDYALENPQDIRALIMVGPGPCGFEIEDCAQELFSEAKKAFEAGDLKHLAEIETQMWFDCMYAEPDQVDRSMRALLYDMNRSVLGRETDNIEQSQEKTANPSAIKMNQIDFPVLIVVGSEDLPYMHSAADYFVERIRSARKEIIEHAAHIPNIDQPHLFQKKVMNFLDEVTSGQDYDHIFR